MKKKIIIDADDDGNVKKVEKNIYKRRQKLVTNGFLEWLVYMIGYALVLVIASKLFRSLDINLDNFGVYALLAAIIIYVFNQTIKPILRIITLPLTIISLGLLYPLTNVIILYLTSLLLGKNFVISGFIAPFIIAVFISILNLIMEGLVIKPIINGKNK